MPRFKNSETFPERAISIIIVGTPFSYKTSLALTAIDVLLIDVEKGAERAKGRAKETFRLGDKGWQEYRDEVLAGMLDDFQTVAIDTGGAFIDDALWDFALKVKYTANSQKNWGTVKEEFKKDYTKIRSLNKDLIVISHEKSVKDDDTTIYDLDMSGAAKNILLRGADMVGFIYKKDFKVENKIVTKTILTFNPTASTPFCKNVAQLPDIELPHHTSTEWEGFLDRIVIKPTKKAISAMSEEQIKTLEAIAEWQASISSTTPEEDANFSDTLTALMKSIGEIEADHIKLQVQNYFRGHLKSIGWKYDAQAKVFKAIEEKPAPATEQKPAEDKTPPPVEHPAKVEPAADSNPNGLLKKVEDEPQGGDNSLFDPAKE